MSVIDKPSADHPVMNSAAYRALMRHQAGAVAIVAAGEEGARAGLTATAVSSLSDSPPTILVCIGKDSDTHKVISKTECFSVNVLANDQQDIAERFAGRHGHKGEEKFRGLVWDNLITGAPLLTNALANLDCELLEQHKSTTHTIFIGKVIAGRFRDEAEPLLYFRGDYWDLTSKS